MKMEMATRGLIHLLEDISLTASKDTEDPGMNGVVLHTDRGTWSTKPRARRGEPEGQALIDTVATDLLVATSADRYSVAQCHYPCTGGLPRPVFVRLSDVASAIGLCGQMVTKAGRNVTHHVIITLRGDTLCIQEDPTMHPDGVLIEVPGVVVPVGFPRDPVSMLSPDPMIPVVVDGEVVEPTLGTGYYSQLLSVAATVGSRRRMPVVLYRHHQRRLTVVEVGQAYRMVMAPAAPDEDAGQQVEPQVPLYRPDLPEPAPQPTQHRLDVTSVGV